MNNATRLTEVSSIRNGLCVTVFEKDEAAPFFKFRATIYRSDVEIDQLWFESIESAKRWAEMMAELER